MQLQSEGEVFHVSFLLASEVEERLGSERSHPLPELRHASKVRLVRRRTAAAHGNRKGLLWLNHQMIFERPSGRSKFYVTSVYSFGAFRIPPGRFGAIWGPILGAILGPNRPKRSQDGPKRTIKSPKVAKTYNSKNHKKPLFFSGFWCCRFSVLWGS